jgi:hypothetical protein
MFLTVLDPVILGEILDWSIHVHLAASIISGSAPCFKPTFWVFKVFRSQHFKSMQLAQRYNQGLNQNSPGDLFCTRWVRETAIVSVIVLWTNGIKKKSDIR